MNTMNMNIMNMNIMNMNIQEPTNMKPCKEFDCNLWGMTDLMNMNTMGNMKPWWPWSWTYQL